MPKFLLFFYSFPKAGSVLNADSFEPHYITNLTNGNTIGFHFFEKQRKMPLTRIVKEAFFIKKIDFKNYFARTLRSIRRF